MYASSHTVKRRALVDLEITAPPARLAGWDFLAVVEPMTGGNLIRQVPGAEVAEGELDAWRTGSIACDHCKTARHRKETFILRREGAQAGDTGFAWYREVGRQCLAAFLGGRSAAEIVDRLSWERRVREAGGDEYSNGGGSAPIVYDPVEFLVWCCAIARLDGFVTKGQAAASDPNGLGVGLRATASVVESMLGDPPGDSRARQEWKEARERYTPQEDDIVRAQRTLTWARALPGRSDYEKSLQLVASQGTLQPKHAGILASAVPAYARELGEQVRRQARGAGEHYGAIGDRMELDLVIEKRIPIPGYRDGQSATIITFHGAAGSDTAGLAFVWRTSVDGIGAVGDRVRLKGTIKAHTEYKGERQTELKNCRVRPADFVPTPTIPTPAAKRAFDRFAEGAVDVVKGAKC
jgi:hypothetical protein